MDDVGWGMDHSDSEFDTAALPSRHHIVVTLVISLHKLEETGK